MIVREAVRGRRSVRRFLRDRPITDDALEALINALIRAPSAGSLHARFFYFIFGVCQWDIQPMPRVRQ